ncbi:EAL domain-containing protein [Halopseudomonas pachastrellae]|nr:EAL domain-containing protein [Halopseudomonas pachastrellae]
MRDDEGNVRSAGPLFTDPGHAAGRPAGAGPQHPPTGAGTLPRYPEGFLSLNISPAWISQLQPGKPLPSLQLLEEMGIASDQVVFEITELQGSIEQLREVVQRYRAAGIRIAIDDFGAGYSMLDRVLALEPDILKLDIQLFRQAAAGNGNSGDFVRALALMAEKSGCWIIAEGVEDRAGAALCAGVRRPLRAGLPVWPAGGELPAQRSRKQQFSRMRDHYVHAKLAEREKLAHLRRSLAELFAELRQWLQTGRPTCAPARPTQLPVAAALFSV